ncbi:MAG: hypothetical protein Q9167_005843, partial [Letrouitia subvulpina]
TLKPPALAPGQVDRRLLPSRPPLRHKHILDTTPRSLEHRLRQQPLAATPQAPRPGPHLERLLRDLVQRAPCKAQLDPREREQVLVLLQKAVAGLCQHTDEVGLGERGQGGGDGNAADKFGDQAVGLEVRGLEEVEGVVFRWRGGGGRGEERKVLGEELGFWRTRLDSDGLVLGVWRGRRGVRGRG